ncbi:MAG TPA: deaminase [Allosphingosinicella sp.]
MKSPSKTDVDERYLQLAHQVRATSDDPKSEVVPGSGVGAVIVGSDGIIVTSANVLPPALKERYTSLGLSVDYEDRYFVIEHAERAAILKAFVEGHDLRGLTMYASRFPCSDCARAIVWAGFKRAVFSTGLSGERFWLPSQQAALRILRGAGVTVRILRSKDREDLPNL